MQITKWQISIHSKNMKKTISLRKRFMLAHQKNLSQKKKSIKSCDGSTQTLCSLCKVGGRFPMLLAPLKNSPAALSFLNCISACSLGNLPMFREFYFFSASTCPLPLWIYTYHDFGVYHNISWKNMKFIATFFSSLHFIAYHDESSKVLGYIIKDPWKTNRKTYLDLKLAFHSELPMGKSFGVS